MGRRVANPAAAEALDVRFRDAAEGENHGSLCGAEQPSGL